MARGNWRNWEARNGAMARASSNKVIDGWAMKLIGRFPTEEEARKHAEYWVKEGYHSRVLPGSRKKKDFRLYRTFRRDQTRQL